MQILTSKKIARFVILICLMSATLPALAHVDASHVVSGFGSGFLHPLMGLDHLLAMLAVGIWAAQNQRPALWLLSVVFPVMMACGAILVVDGFHLPGVEVGIALSISVLGLLIAFAINIPVIASCALVGIFALIHGYAHGVELPTGESGVLYGAGFMLATALIHLLGLAGSFWANTQMASRATRVAGAGIAAIGMVFLSSLG
ncbi:MAG: HupE/UreJ family protein [Undibacterium sp.]|uniref:HupE/UreJ family protein n=1 Tax=Undibacterium sp. TaxID=1914977 RepID=UPI00272486CF|nr:HupE/UreJ family protein [Undibacterium sp.]MDO8654335.1 HupE/UreJ family protein [Undibacterium sp.]